MYLYVFLSMQTHKKRTNCIAMTQNHAYKLLLVWYILLSYYTYHRMISFCMAINCRNILERWSFCTVDMMREKNMRTMAQYAVIIPHPSYYSGSSLVSISVSVDWHSYFRYKCELSHLARSSKKMASNLLIIEISVAHNNVDCGERPLL